MNPNDAWNTWKKGFDAWEGATAKLVETWLKSPLVLGPSGAMLTGVMRMKAASDRAASMWWGAMGLPTKRDQERTLHALNQIQSRLLDLEEKLEDQGRSGMAERRNDGPTERRNGGTAARNKG
jgi:hypothetical protein